MDKYMERYTVMSMKCMRMYVCMGMGVRADNAMMLLMMLQMMMAILMISGDDDVLAVIIGVWFWFFLLCLLGVLAHLSHTTPSYEIHLSCRKTW